MTADKIAEAHPPQMWATCEWCVEHRNEEAVTLPDEIRWDGQKWSCEDCWDPEDDGWDHAPKASDLADTQAQEIARLRSALAWYGEQARLCRLIHSEGDAGRHALDNDGGKRARAALGDAP